MSRTISTRPVARATKQAATAALAESHPFQDVADEPFDDAFLNRWIDAQLGSHERRGMIRVWARRDPAAAGRAGGQSDGDGALFADRAWAAMSAAGGHVWRSEPGLVSAVWGAPRAIAQDCRR